MNPISSFSNGMADLAGFAQPLDLVSQGHRRERRRLAANPSRSDQFGPWHLADLVGPPDAAELPPNPLNDAFAIRYRVL